jgi:putative phage-type endonuclease
MTKKIVTEPLSVKTWGDAVFLGIAENQSEQWHAMRATGIGGSDVGTICGLNPWQSPFTLWAKKTGRFEDKIQSSEAMEWGTRLESVILDKFEESHPELKLHRNVGTWHNKDRAWQLANPDAVATDLDGNDIIIEVKTARYEDDWAKGVPAYYRTQVLWYLQTFGFKKAIVVALFSGSKYREFEVEFDSFEAEVNLNRVIEFRGYLEFDLAPDFDGATSTFQTIREMHPMIEDNEVELGQLYTYYALAIHDEKQAVEHANEMRSRVLAAMGSAKRGLFDGVVVVTRQARNGGTPYLVNKRG